MHVYIRGKKFCTRSNDDTCKHVYVPQYTHICMYGVSKHKQSTQQTWMLYIAKIYPILLSSSVHRTSGGLLDVFYIYIKLQNYKKSLHTLLMCVLIYKSFLLYCSTRYMRQKKFSLVYNVIFFTDHIQFICRFFLSKQ